MVEVTSLVRGEIQSLRRFSPARERLEVVVAGAGVMVAGAVGLLLALAWTGRTGTVLKAASFAALWALAVTAALVVAVRATRWRARRYVVGAGMDADAFADREMELVRRRGRRYELRLVPGLAGWLRGGRAAVPIDGLVASGPVAVMIEEQGWAELHSGTSSFVVRAVPDARPWSGFGRGWLKRLSHHLVLPVAAGALAAVLCSGPARGAITEADMRSAIPPRATPWEAEKILRRQAQLQSHTLHRCFDPLPVSCHRPGFVAVGVSLSREGDIKARWIARSTYGQDCPVDECMADVVSTWIFDSLPEPMRVVLPVQVVRTGKPLPQALAAPETAGAGRLALLDGGP